MDNDTHLVSTKPGATGSGPEAPTVHVVDYATQSGGTLLPMLISGLVLIIACMIALMVFF